MLRILDISWDCGHDKRAKTQSSGFTDKSSFRPSAMVKIPQQRLKAAETNDHKQAAKSVFLCLVGSFYESLRSWLIWRDVHVQLPHTEKSQVVWASGGSNNFVQVILTETPMTVTWGIFMQIHIGVGDVYLS